jgi:hypothetical protein
VKNVLHIFSLLNVEAGEEEERAGSGFHIWIYLESKHTFPKNFLLNSQLLLTSFHVMLRKWKF